MTLACWSVVWWSFESLSYGVLLLEQWMFLWGLDSNVDAFCSVWEQNWVGCAQKYGLESWCVAGPLTVLSRRDPCSKRSKGCGDDRKISLSGVLRFLICSLRYLLVP
ncbi:uncharacterized protein BDZ83DRAFT_287888 [Colletotrichum acutatum]|uniref:Uncharacterized protein n=1 Tax=Glomerella acutata TaxID=27357 RepID=A0AAD8UMS5_GLOAC|nr:uncharacterized protein BDZ83DRAFT_287888 [Colletotrichum acutatum]KAK1725692.1 hypothetical protein BDZ83DRAFT_287888 [Colletotrichum acutatum]